MDAIGKIIFVPQEEIDFHEVDFVIRVRAWFNLDALHASGIVGDHQQYLVSGLQGFCVVVEAHKKDVRPGMVFNIKDGELPDFRVVLIAPSAVHQNGPVRLVGLEHNAPRFGIVEGSFGGDDFVR